MKKTNKFKRIAVLFLVLSTAMGLMPITALAVDATIVTTAAELISVFTDGGTAVLVSDITLTEPLVAASGKTVTLDLNGKTIDRGLTEGPGAFSGNVITVNGCLTLNDSIGSGRITGGRKDSFTGGGGIYVAGTGALTMNGGSVSGNTAEGNSVNGGIVGGYGGGVYVAKDGSFTMSGGDISNNRSAGNGGGIYLEANSSLSMSNGSICDNTAAKGGGGVYAEGTPFTMDNGTISGNTAAGDGGGVAVVMGGIFTMNGGSISGNTAAVYGGGAYVFYGSAFTMNGGTISSNSAEQGGGIYFDTTAFLSYGVGTLAISGGEIIENTTDSSCGGGVYIASGDVTISGGSKINRNKAVTGAGIFMLDGTCVMENSEICENTTIFKSGENHGGGGVFLASGDFTMNSGKINKNTAIRGGGIFVSASTFTMKNGQINENATTLDGLLCDGGGVYLNASGTFCMEGGEIRGNATTAWNMYNHGGGIFVQDGIFKISGGAAITGNSRSGVPNNVYLKTNTSEIQVANSLTGLDGSIGVSTDVSATPLTVAQGDDYTIVEADFKKFTHDTGGSLNLAENKITLLNPNASYLAVLSYNANDGSGTHDSTAILEGMDNHLTVASGDGFSRTYCSFSGWNTKPDGSGASYQPGGELILTANTVLYAQWTIDRVELTATVPQGGAAPSASAACVPAEITAGITWKQGEDNLTGSFDYNTIYSAEFTLVAGPGCKFAASPEVLVNDQPAAIQSGSDAVLTASFTFPKTGPRIAPVATVSHTTINVANTGGSKPLTLNIAGIVDGCNSLTWTMNETDTGNILTLPSITTGLLANGALSLGSVTVAANADGQAAKSASVTISFNGNENSDYSGVPASITVIFCLSAGNAPEAGLDFIAERIIGISAGTEYLVSDDVDAPDDWTGATPVTGTEIALGGIIPAAGSDSKYIHIRVMGIDGSLPQTVTIPARPDLVAFFGDTWDSWVTYNIFTDVETGGVYQDFGYRINSGTDMINNSGGPLDIPLIPGDTLTFWMPASSSNFKSAEITITAPERLEEPNVAIDFENRILNTAEPMQYRLSADDDWTDCTAGMAVTEFGWNGTAPVAVQLRYPYTADLYASEAQILTIPALPAPPVISYTSTATTIAVTAEAGVRYRLEGGVWRTADENGKVVFTGLVMNSSYTVDAQKPATESAFQSTITSLAVSTSSLADGTGSVTMSGWTYGCTAAEPVPVSATNGIDGVTYTYAGTKADGMAYSSSAKPTDAGSYTVTATFSATSDYKQVISQAASFTIVKKEIDVQWKNLTAVYDGAPKSPAFTLIGVESGDTSDVSAQLSESKTNAGSYSVTAALSGSRAFNYSLTNPSGTMVIQKAPVIFSITADSVQHDGSSHTAAVTAAFNGSIFSAFSVIYKDSSGGTVASPSAEGSYGIYAQITDANYRHADATDGTAKKIGVLTIYAVSAPDTYTVSFSGGDGAVGSVTTLTAVQEGTIRILPDSTGLTNGTKLFAGWKYGGKIYQPGEGLSQPDSNITLTAIWTENSYTVSGVVYQGGNPLPDAVVTLMRGCVQIGQTVTDAGGEYSFANAAPGLYNLVACKNGVTQTVLVEIVRNVMNQNILLPSGKTNSVVEVAAGSPVIVVGNLEQTFSNADQQAAGNGSTVEMKLTAKALDGSSVDQAAINAAASDTVGLYLELNLSKTVTPVVGSPSTTAVTESGVLLKIVVQIPGELQGKDNYVVYRRHNDEVHTLTTTPNSDGEHITVNADKTSITIYTKLFSTYAIGYATQTGSGGGGISSGGYTITAEAGKGGSISPDGAVNVTKGSTRTFTITPDKGYVISDVLMDGVSIGAVGSYTFSDIAASHTIKAVFAEATGLPYYLDAEGNKVFLGFSSDASGSMEYIAPEGETILFAHNPKEFADTTDHWAKSSIDFITQREIFQGTGAVTFSPDVGMTRGMLATVVGRLYERSYGMLSPSRPSVFTDIAADAYYATYVLWAEENGIIEGVGGGKFDPDRMITREEMAMILYRFAKFLEVSDTEISGIQLSYSDPSEISPWAIDAVKYCQETNFITGRGNGNFEPKETATRAEVATILERFITAIV